MKPIIADKLLFFGGNLKASMPPSKAKKYISDMAKHNAKLDNRFVQGIRQSQTTVMIAPPAASLTTLRSELEVLPYLSIDIKLGVQNPWIKAGAYTGATTFEDAIDKMIGAQYAIIGHSETRQLGRYSLSVKKPRHSTVGNSGQVYALAIQAALGQKITPIYCVGETLEQREAGLTEKVIDRQLIPILSDLAPEQIRRLVIAYEPVWAIGTGETATPADAQNTHKHIAKMLMYFTNTKENVVPIIYGGSMKPENVAALVSQPNIHGGLVGGASLRPETFMGLIMNGIEAVKTKQRIK